MSQSSFGVQINDASCEIQAGRGGGGGGTKKKRKPKRGRQDAQKVVGSVSFKVGDCWRKYGLYLL